MDIEQLRRMMLEAFIEMVRIPPELLSDEKPKSGEYLRQLEYGLKRRQQMLVKSKGQPSKRNGA